MRWREAGSRATASAPNPLAIHPWVPAGPLRARAAQGQQPEQGRSYRRRDLADHGVWPRRNAARISPNRACTRRRAADTADRGGPPTARSSPLSQAPDLPGVPGATAQTGHDRHRPAACRGQGTTAPSVTKAWHSRKAGRFGFLAWSNRTAAPCALAEQRGARVSSITAKRRGPRVSRRTMPHNAATRPSRRRRAPLQHPVVGLPAPPRRHRQQRPGDAPAAAQHGSDKKLGDGAPGGPRDGPHDLPHPCGQRRRRCLSKELSGAGSGRVSDFTVVRVALGVEADVADRRPVADLA